MSIKRNAFILFAVLALMVVAFGVPLRAQEMMDKPQINVTDQVSMNGLVRIASAYSEGPGFVVIHVDNAGKPGGVEGYHWLNSGWNFNIDVEIGDEEMPAPTPVMYAMLHVDDGEVGAYEFDGKSGLDNPVKDADGKVITPAFTTNGFDADDQFVQGSKVLINVVTVPVDSWIVVHSGDMDKFGGVLGQTAVKAGTTMDVEVALSGDMTEVLWPMIHVDDGAAGTYEFDGKSGLDNPVVVNGVVASAPIWTVPHVRMDPQIVIPGDGMTMMEKPIAHVSSVLSKGPGVIVIHKDNEGKPGGVAGFALVQDGFNDDVDVELDAKEITPVLWPMLHVDDGAVGTYEFDGQSGLDNPVADSAGKVIVFPVMAAPSIALNGKKVDDTHLWVQGAIIDEPGWLAIHADNGKGEPGPVIGVTPLLPGVNMDIVVEIKSGMTEKVFPMLHYDDGALGKYEFDGKNGLDNPTFVGGKVIVGPLEMMAE